MFRPSSMRVTRQHIFLIVLMSLLLISSFALVTSFSAKNVLHTPASSLKQNILSNSNRFSTHRPKAVTSTRTSLLATTNDETEEKKFYGFKSLAGMGIPTGQRDHLAISSEEPSGDVSQGTVTFSPALTVPSVRTSAIGFSDIPSITSTSSPSSDSTLSFNSDRPKSQAIFTMLNRLKRLNYKFELLKKLKITTWDSPRGEKGELKREILAGLVVALATVPTSVAYSSVIGLSPLVGIWSSAIVGGIVAIVGGGPGIIAGASGVVALPMAKLVAAHGTAYMGAAVILAAIFESAFGIARLGKLCEHVEEPVIAGFLNAFAVFLVKSQMKVFTVAGAWLLTPQLKASVAIAGLCAGIINILPFFSKAIPPSLIGLVVSSLVAVFFKLPIKSLADVAGAATFSGGLSSLPRFQGIPAVSFSLTTLNIILSTSVGVALIATLETILASRIACDSYRCRVDAYEEDNPNRLVVGLGIGNAVSALFGGFGGCGLIPNTLLNGDSGGEGYASSFAYSAFLALFVVVFAPVIGKIPMASLAGLMLNVAFNTFEWKESLGLVRKSRKSLQGFLDLIGMLVTFFLCFKVDMGLGIVVGVVITKAINIAKAVRSTVQNTQLKVSGSGKLIGQNI